MRCPTSDDWMLLSIDQVGGGEARRRRAHLEGCGACREIFARASREHAQLKRLYRATDQGHEALREQLMDALPEAPPRPRAAEPRDRRRRWTSGLAPLPRRTAWAMAAAAAVAAAAFLFVGHGESVAFGQVARHFQNVETIVCHMTRTITGNDRPFEVDGRLYFSADHGSLATFYVEGLNVLTVWAPAGGPLVRVNHGRRPTYSVIQMSDDDPDAPWRKGPGGHLKGLRSLTEDAGVPLAERLFDGRQVQGFEIPGDKLGLEDPTASAEIWVEKATGLPVSYTLTAAWPVPGQRVVETFDRFEWNTPLPAAIFEPSIPEGYTQVDLDMPPADEEALVRGLRVFAELSGGSYPESLASYPESLSQVRVNKELETILVERYGGDDFDPSSPLYEEALQKIVTVGNACRFYSDLVKGGREPEYFGAGVRAGDAESVLLEWRLDDGGTRVIYGDLYAETLPADGHDE
ncbi:MAG: hypothetical protein GY719_21630 [bacterium]|nr:hypothetical protein [bacterium]